MDDAGALWISICILTIVAVTVVAVLFVVTWQKIDLIYYIVKKRNWMVTIMIDCGKIIKGLECHMDPCAPCAGCPYNDSNRDCAYSLCEDALNLLKEQETEIERLEHDLAVTQDNLNYYVNGNR